MLWKLCASESPFTLTDNVTNLSPVLSSIRCCPDVSTDRMRCTTGIHSPLTNFPGIFLSFHPVFLLYIPSSNWSVDLGLFAITSCCSQYVVHYVRFYLQMS